MRWRWAAWVLGGLATAAIVLAAGGWLLLGRMDLASLVAARATAALGRPVALRSLVVVPGRWLGVTAEGFALANLPGGTRDDMVRLARVEAEVDALSLLRGPVLVRRLRIDGLSVLLERAGGKRNWRLGTAAERTGPPTQADRGTLPVVLDLQMHDSEIVFRTSSGTALVTRLAEASTVAASTDQPVQLAVTGSYNGVPVTVGGTLQPIAVLRDPTTPYGMELHMRSGETTLDIAGTTMAPLDVDQVVAQLALKAPDLSVLRGATGMGGQFDARAELAGRLERDGDTWHLRDASGSFGDSPITHADIRLDEGSVGAPDRVKLAIAFGRLDLNQLISTKDREAGGNADLSLAVDQAPDTLIEAALSADTLVYAALQAEQVHAAAALLPGKVEISRLTMTTLGAQAQASGQLEAAPEGGRLSAEVSVKGASTERLRPLLGFGPLPVQGDLDAVAEVSAQGAWLNQAALGGHVAAVLTMNGGRISREVIELASIDLRQVFRRARGATAVSCMLAVLEMRAGVGTLSPLRVRAAEGTIAGAASFDLFRRRMDLTIGSESATTGSFALDIPVRVSGSFADPTIRPAQWSREGRAALAAAYALPNLSAPLKEAARASRCLR